MILLVLVPLLALVGIYACAIVSRINTAIGLANAGKITGTTITPVSDALVALDAERSGAVRYLSAPSNQSLAALRQSEAATNRQFRFVDTITKSGPVTANATQLEKATAATFVRDDKGSLQSLRSEVASGTIGRTAAINSYSAIMADGVRVAEQSLQGTYVSQSLATTARQDVSLYRADMLAMQENDIYSGDVVARQMPAADQEEFAQLVNVRRYLVQDAIPQLNAEASGLLRKELPASLTAALISQENAITSAPTVSPVAPVAPALWQRTVQTYAGNLRVMLRQSTNWIQSQVTASARRALTTLIIAASLGLLAVLVSIVFSLLMGRRLLRRLSGLRQSALELAHDRLPSVMTRLRDGETVHVDAEAPPVEAGSDEIDQVRQAFNTVHRAAVEAALDEANLRRGLSEVFRNLARRSQALLHRQLGLLDGMERRAEETEQLEDLFRIDHLTTRMRRHAEGLIVLSGESAGRAWRQPVTFINVLRAAVAEVEAYTRIRVEVRSKAALAGPAVADVVHLLAELIENATVFSPPNTVVRVQGELVGRGFAVEVEDRGLGIAEVRLEEINRDLAGLPAFDLANSDRLGLFIAGRLAHRHDIKIALRSSVYGGITAVVIIPTNLVITDESQVPPLAAPVRMLQQAAAPGALSSGNGHGGNGHGGNGYADNGHAGNGYADNEHAGIGHAGNGHAGNGHAGSGYADNEHAGNGYAGNEHAGNGHAGNGHVSGSDSASPAELGGADGRTAADPASPAASPAAGAAAESPLPVRRAAGTPADPRIPRHSVASATAGDVTADAQPFPATPPASAESDSPAWPAPASTLAAESVEAGQAIGTATELVRDLDSSPAPARQHEAGLPVRVRQAGLAPQLRDRDLTDTGAFYAAPSSAESLRNSMSAMQRGWQLGRSVASGPWAGAGPDAASADQNPAGQGGH
jgi:signal transduction histidine kinase